MDRYSVARTKSLISLLVVDVPFDLLHRDLALSTSHLYSSISPKSYAEARESRQAWRKPQPRQRAGLLWLRATSLIPSADLSSATVSRSLPRSWSSKRISSERFWYKSWPRRTGLPNRTSTSRQ